MKAEAVKALRYRRKAKSSSDLKNSLVHQCEKSLNKAVKTIKGFLLQKAARNLNELKSKVDQTSEIQLQIEKESERITNMKQIETAKVTGSIMESKILPRINKTEENKPDFSIPFMDRMMSHKKMVELLATLSTKIKHSYHQNSILQAAEAKKQKKSVSQAKGLLTERKISVVSVLYSSILSFFIVMVPYFAGRMNEQREFLWNLCKKITCK